MSSERRVGRPIGLLILAAAAPLLVVAVIVLWQVSAARAHLAASSRVVGVGVDEQGYWFVRVEVQNTGNIPWEAVFVSDTRVVGSTSPALEVGSTLPSGPVPDRFEFVIETVDEGGVPQAPEAVSFELGVISQEPWFLPARKTGHWFNDLSL